VLWGQAPITIEVDPGTHRVRASPEGLIPVPYETEVNAVARETVDVEFTIVPGHSRTVLVEDFSNTNCHPCVPAEELLLGIAGEFPLAQLVTVNVHNLIPGPLDPMYWANASELESRSDLYGVNNNPTFAIDGSTIFGAAPEADALRDSIEAHLNRPSPIDLEITCSVVSDTVTADVRVRAVSNPPGDLRLIVITLQTEIDYGDAPGTNGQSVFTRVVRDFLPDADGQPIAITAGMEDAFEFSADLLDASHPLADPPDDPAKVACIAIIQDQVTREILQTGSTLD
jgi:thiol-disulfide isomerase/thioredoxin